MLYIKYIQSNSQYLSLFFFNTDLRNNKQTIKKPKAAKAPTARATVLCVSSDPDPIEHKIQALINS